MSMTCYGKGCCSRQSDIHRLERAIANRRRLYVGPSGHEHIEFRHGLPDRKWPRRSIFRIFHITRTRDPGSYRD